MSDDDILSNKSIFNQFEKDSDIVLHEPVDTSLLKEVSIEHDQINSIFWMFMHQTTHPCYDYELGDDVEKVHKWIKSSYSNKSISQPSDLKYFVTGSKTPNIFNLGGDLLHFADCIENGDFQALKKYAETCVRMQYDNYCSFNAPLITIALVQGDALGGGFEHALTSDIIVAEKNARMGLPEITFNLFPGMGAYSLLSRKVGQKLTEDIIMGGRIYEAEQLYEMGVIDYLVMEGEGASFINEYVRKNTSKFAAHHAICKARKYSNPITLDELMYITGQWVETAKTINMRDIKKMRRIVDIQKRRFKQLAS